MIACLGDSITEGSPEFDSRRGGNVESQWEHWVARACPELELRNFGRWGERTDEIADRFEEAVRGADAVVIQGGINDVAQGRPVERAAENLRELVRRAQERGVRVVLANVLPWNNGGDDAAPKIRRLNELIAELASAENVPLLDFHAALADPDAPDRMKEDWAHADGDHPSPAGYRRLGEATSGDLVRALGTAKPHRLSGR